MMIKEESVLSVLMYLFKYHMRDSCALDAHEQELVPKLEKLGFKKPIIIQALVWIANLTRASEALFSEPSETAYRVFSAYECEFLDSQCRGFIINMEKQGILNPITRELVINQAIYLATEDIDISLLKWVILIVLFHQPNEDKALACMEYLVLDDNVMGEKH